MTNLPNAPTFKTLNVGSVFTDFRNQSTWVKVDFKYALILSPNESVVIPPDLTAKVPDTFGTLDDDLIGLLAEFHPDECTDPLDVGTLLIEPQRLMVQHSPEHPAHRRDTWLARCMEQRNQLGYWQWVAARELTAADPAFGRFDREVRSLIGEVQRSALLSLFEDGFSASEAVTYLNT